MDWTDIERQLCDKAEEVCRVLLPDGKRIGAEWVGGTLGGQFHDTLKVNLAGKTGLWSHFATGRGGKTLMSLWCHVRAAEFKFCIREAKQFLGLRDDFEKRFERPGGGPKPAGKLDAASLENYKPLTGGCAVLNYLTLVRKLDPMVLEAYGVGQTLDGKGIVYPYYASESEEESELLGAEDPLRLEQPRSGPSWLKFEALERREGKKVEWTTRGPAKCLFGKRTVKRGERKLIITEGEKDAMAWATYGHPAVSVPFGAKWKGQDKGRPSPNREWIDRDWGWLENFETIFVSLDGDPAGRKAALDVIEEIGPRRCRLVTLPEKPEGGQKN
jgi:twinkle protein